MKQVFADANYWIALLHRNDSLHSSAVGAQKKLKKAQLVTTDEALGEVLNFFSGRGAELRNIAAQTIEGLRADPRTRVVEQSRATFDGGLGHYKARGDKGYSFVDCVSFELMTREGIQEALTEDHHFEQAGFIVLLKKTI
jgi:hypothetical protein